MCGGVNCNWIKVKDYQFNKPYKQRPLHFVYVGGVKELKGISYLLEAFREIPVELADLTVVGDYCEKDTDTTTGKTKTKTNL